MRCAVMLPILLLGGSVAAAELSEPPTASADEPLVGQFSLQRAYDFLDQATLHWNNKRKCITCHTNGLYLAAATAGEEPPAGYAETRAFAEKYLEQYLPQLDDDPSRGAIHSVLSTVAFLAISDAQTTGKLQPLTRRGLDDLWRRQTDDGCWNDWAKCNWPPYEQDDHFGATLAAVAVGIAPDNYAQTPAAVAGMEKLRTYLKNHPPTGRHQQGMLLWAAAHVPDLLSNSERDTYVASLWEAQQADGGWSLADLAGPDWERDDGTPIAPMSDGYATGFAIFILRQADVPADDARIQEGLQWLQTHQRASGRWFTRSPKKDGHHYISRAGTSFAVLALTACGVRE